MPNARLVTADELERMLDDGYRYELVRGRLIRMSPVAPRHGGVTIALGALLWQHVRARKLGRVWTEVGFRLESDPDTVLAPDVAFVRADRAPSEPEHGFFRGAPDVAFEVLSPDDRPGEVRDKLRDYFAAGTPMVVVVDPRKRRVVIHRSEVAPVELTSADTLDLEAAIPGFRVRLADILEN